MNMKTIVILESQKEDRTYTLMLPPGAALGECYDALHEFMAKILQLSQEAADKAKPTLPTLKGDSNA
jgi:hypothetical protein